MVTGVVESTCEKSPPFSAAVGTDPTLLLPLRLSDPEKLTVYCARCQLTSFGICSGPPTLALTVLFAEYGFCAVCPFKEKGAALSAELRAVMEIDPDSGGVVRRRLPKLANCPLKGPRPPRPRCCPRPPPPPPPRPPPPPPPAPPPPPPPRQQPIPPGEPRIAGGDVPHPRHRTRLE